MPAERPVAVLLAADAPARAHLTAHPHHHMADNTKPLGMEQHACGPSAAAGDTSIQYANRTAHPTQQLLTWARAKERPMAPVRCW